MSGFVRSGAFMGARATMGKAVTALSLSACLWPSLAAASWPSPVPPLPSPTGVVVQVSTEAQLQSAVSAMSSGRTIVIAPGVYNLTNSLYINGSFSDVSIRGATNNASDVVLVGKGMSNESYGNVPHGIWTGNGVTRVTIANLTVRDVYYHPIAFNPGTQAPRVYNVRLINAGEQFIKASSSPNGGTHDGVVEYSLFEYVTTARSDYTNAIDVHQGRNWVIRNNFFRNIRAPQGQLAGPAILMWNTASGTVVDGNTFVNCQREISLGLIERAAGSGPPYDHSGGIVRNNFIYRAPSTGGDSPIAVFDSPGTAVVHNTVIVSGGCLPGVEDRWADTTGVLIANNLTDAPIQSRNGATATLQNNYTTATASFFVDPANGDLHLRTSATAAIDRGTPVSNAGSDWDGSPRPSGSASDIGADEQGGSATLPPPPAAPTNLRIS